MDELKNLIQELKNCKTCGDDKIYAEMIKNLGDVRVEVLFDKLNKRL